MQLTIVAVLVLALEVVDAICHVAGLLYLGEETAGTDSVNTSCRQEEAVALLHVIACNGIANGVVGNHLGILCRSDLLLQTAQQCSVLVRVEQIPHLGLATLLALTLGYLVGRMNLYREVLTCIDKLDEQRELIAEALVVLLTYEFLLLFSNNLVELLASELAIGYYSLIAWHARNLPALAYILLLHIKMLERDNLLATPNRRLEQRVKLHWFHNSCI